MGEAADEIFTIRLVDTVTVRGKSQSCKIYEVLDGDRYELFYIVQVLTFSIREEVKIQKKRLLGAYNKGITLFNTKKYQEALLCFEVCLRLR